MDEQEIIAVEDYEEPEFNEAGDTAFEESEPQTQNESPEDYNADWRVNKDGEVEFSEEYLGEVEQNLFPERTQDEPVEDTEPAQSRYYTKEELANTPYEQWDINRLNGNVRDFVPIVQQQLAARQAQAVAAQRQAANQLSNFIQPPVQYRTSCGIYGNTKNIHKRTQRRNSRLRGLDLKTPKTLTSTKANTVQR